MYGMFGQVGASGGLAQVRPRSRSPRRANPGEDWYCPNCCDLQFKSNPACRICGLSREFGLAELPNISIEHFLSGHTIAETALHQFRSLPADVQKTIMSAGSLHGVRDPTAVLISRMSKVSAPRSGDWFCPSCHDHQFAKNACCRNCGAVRPDDPALCGPPDAATFLKNHIIDDQVLSRFLALTPEQQHVVICRGTLNGSRDPSAVLSSRITQVKNGNLNTGKSMFPGKGGKKGGGDLQLAQQQQQPTPQDLANQQLMQMMMMQQMMGQDPSMQQMMVQDPSMQQMMGQQQAAMASMMGQQQAGMVKTGTIQPRQGDWFCGQCGDHQFSKNAVCRNCGAARPTDGSELRPPDPETFLAVHANCGLDENAILRFRSLDPASQSSIISRGSLNGARDPNAVLLARIKELEQGRGLPLGSLSGGQSSGMRIVPSSSDWYCPNCYDLQFKNNDNCRICGTSRALGVKDISNLDPARFLEGHKLEPNVVSQFQSLTDDMKRVVMSGGSLHGARDPTAVLINRMVKAQCPREGDWYCQQCGDHQFAKNSSCRNCGSPKPIDGSHYTPPDSMTFLANHPVEDHAKVKFLSLDLNSQNQIIQKGSLAGARDPTAVLLARIQEVEETRKRLAFGSSHVQPGFQTSPGMIAGDVQAGFQTSPAMMGGGMATGAASMESQMQQMMMQQQQMMMMQMMQQQQQLQQQGGGCAGAMGGMGSLGTSL